MGFDPGPKLLASTLDVRKSEVAEMDQRLEGGISPSTLRSPRMDDRPTWRHLPGTEALEERVADDHFREILSRGSRPFRQLKDKEAFLLKNRLLAEDPLTLQAVGDELKISRERARQIEKRVLTKLKAY